MHVILAHSLTHVEDMKRELDEISAPWPIDQPVINHSTLSKSTGRKSYFFV